MAMTIVKAPTSPVLTPALAISLRKPFDSTNYTRDFYQLAVCTQLDDNSLPPDLTEIIESDPQDNQVSGGSLEKDICNGMQNYF